MKSKRIFVVIGVFLVILCNSIVYGALNTEMFIDGDAYVRIDKNIRVTGIKVIEQTNGAYETYNCDYSKNTTSIQATLPSSDSSIVYEVTITNKGDVNYEVTNIDEESCSNSNIKYELIDLEKGTVINGKESYAFKIKLTNVGNNIDDKTVLVLKYTFECLQREWTFEYTGSEQEFKVPYDGEYKIELWGASGDNTGAYTAGVLNLDNYINKKLYVYVGEQRKVVYGVSYTNSGLTYNGGGEGDYFTASNYPYRARGGGGATDVRLVGGLWSDFNSLKSRIMVAGAGGSCFKSSCSGGGLVGYTAADYNNGYGGTQLSGGSATSPATSGSFGKGGNGYISYRSTAWNNDGFGAGSGYFGGGGGYGGTPSGGTNRAGSGGGGSSYISGHAGSVAIEEESIEGSMFFRKDHNDVPCNSSNSSGYNSLGYNTDYICSLHYSGIYFTDTVMIDGEGYSWTTSKNDYVGMPSHDGNSIMKGNSGNGYAKITLMSKK